MTIQDQFDQAIGAKPVVDFDYFHFTDNSNNRAMAQKLAVVLMAFAEIDELHGIHEDDESWPSTVGTGGSGWNYACPSRAAQRSCLASLFSSYIYRQHQSCYIGLAEYQCLKDLLYYLTEDYNTSDVAQQRQIQQGIDSIKMTCQCFEQAYVHKDPGFLFEILKQKEETV